MMLKKIFIFGFVAASISQTVFSQEMTQTVYKSDGSKSQYRFLPVNYDPNQKSIVTERLKEKNLHGLALPSSYVISNSKLPDVRDQGSRGTCVYFSTVGLMEAYFMKKSSKYKDIKLSEECLTNVRNWMYDQGRKYTGDDRPKRRPDPNGDFPVSVVKTIKNNGVPMARAYAQANCNYNSYQGSTVSLPYYQSIYSESQLPAFGKGVTFDVNTNPTIEDLKSLLVKDIPVEVTVFVYRTYMTTSDWRYNSQTDKPSTRVGGHAIQLVGYRTEGSRTIFRFKNSWGSGWGDLGYGTMDDRLLTHSWSYDRNYDAIVSMHD